jgi:orotidine-5'-phosphate decarboxylase
MAELIAALDLPDPESALEVVRPLQTELDWVKIGLELFTAGGPDIVSKFKDLGLKTFVDLKFFDIPNTVYGAVCSLQRCGADLCSLHLLGGKDMLDAAQRARDQGGAGSPLLFGVSLLTSLRAQDLPIASAKDSTELVLDLASLAAEAKLNGVVCSGHEVQAIKGAQPGLACICPGIRLDQNHGDQKRVMTPEGAVRAGADFLVLGRPIFNAISPIEAIRDIRRRMAGNKKN